MRTRTQRKSYGYRESLHIYYEPKPPRGPSFHSRACPEPVEGAGSPTLAGICDPSAEEIAQGHSPFLYTLVVCPAPKPDRRLPRAPIRYVRRTDEPSGSSRPCAAKGTTVAYPAHETNGLIPPAESRQLCSYRLENGERAARSAGGALQSVYARSVRIHFDPLFQFLCDELTAVS